MTEPLTPANCDLRDFSFMPLDVARLRDSGLATRASGDAFRAAVLLWCAAWHQVPCSSLEDDDHELAKLAGYGRDLRGWRKVRGDALRGWVPCDDGRLYHPVVAEKALEGWIEKLTQRKASAAGNASKHGYEFDAGEIEGALTDAAELLRRLNPGSRVLAKRAGKAHKRKMLDPGAPPIGSETASKAAPTGSPTVPQHPPGGSPVEAPAGSPGSLPVRSQGTGTGIGSFSLRSKDACATASPSTGPSKAEPRLAKVRRHDFPPDAFERWYVDYPHKVSRGTAERAFARIVAADDVSFDELCAGVRRYRSSKPADHPWRNPATWLNGKGWLDQPAGTVATPALFDDERVDLGGGLSASPSSIRQVWVRGSWPKDWGPRPGEAGCRVPPALAAELTRAA